MMHGTMNLRYELNFYTPLTCCVKLATVQVTSAQLVILSNRCPKRMENLDVIVCYVATSDCT
jgi:hypothetical protein